MSGSASTKDLADKAISLNELAPGLFGYTAEVNVNGGGADAHATPLVAAARHHPTP